MFLNLCTIFKQQNIQRMLFKFITQFYIICKLNLELVHENSANHTKHQKTQNKI